MLAAQEPFGGFGPVLFLILFACVIVGYATIARLSLLLRERHPAVYDSLGRPTLIWNNSVKNSFAMLGFILSGRFKETRDPEVIRLCRFIRVFTYGYWVVFLAVVVAGFILSAR